MGIHSGLRQPLPTSRLPRPAWLLTEEDATEEVLIGEEMLTGEEMHHPLRPAGRLMVALRSVTFHTRPCCTSALYAPLTFGNRVVQSSATSLPVGATVE